MSVTVTYDQWESKGEVLFGDDRNKWRYVCPCCGHEASIESLTEEFGDALPAMLRRGLRVGRDCVGNFTHRVGCNRRADDLMYRGPVYIEGAGVFDFAGKPFTGEKKATTGAHVERWTPESAPRAGLHFKAGSAAAPPSRTKKAKRGRGR